MWRGFHASRPAEVAVIDPSKGERRLRDSYNIYQVAMDTNPAFKGYPSRTKSLICTGDYSVARSFGLGEGGTSAVFPFDGSPVAVASKQDFFDSHTRLKQITVQDFDSYFRNILRDLNLKLKGTIATSAKQLDELLSDISPHALMFGIAQDFLHHSVTRSRWKKNTRIERRRLTLRIGAC